MIKIRALSFSPALYRIFRIGNIANYIKQAHVFNTNKNTSTAKPYFDIFGPCKLLLVVDASSELKMIILLIIACLIVP